LEYNGCGNADINGISVGVKVKDGGDIQDRIRPLDPLEPNPSFELDNKSSAIACGIAVGGFVLGGIVGDLLSSFAERLSIEAAGSETSLLQKYVSQAAKQVDAAGMEAFTPAQRAAIARNPNLQAMFRGSQIDKAARELIKSDPVVAGLNGMVNKGADFINRATGQWWDMTTPGQWAAHAQKYGPGGTLLITK
jgi:hypothetical protein